MMKKKVEVGGFVVGVGEKKWWPEIGGLSPESWWPEAPVEMRWSPRERRKKK